MHRAFRFFTSMFLIVLSALPAAAITITFDEFGEVSLQPSFTVTTGDITITYDGSGVGGEAAIGDLGPEVGNNLLLGGSIGLLTLDFAQPMSSLGFDFSLDFGENLPEGVIVELYFSDVFLDAYSAAALYNDDIGLALGRFNLAGPQFTQALLLFDANSSQTFTFDNLSVQPIPEPATILLVTGGLVGAGLLRRRLGAV